MGKDSKLVLAGITGFLICFGLYNLGHLREMFIVGALSICIMLYQLEATWKSLAVLSTTVLGCEILRLTLPGGIWSWCYIIIGFLGNLLVECFELGDLYNRESKVRFNWLKTVEAVTAWVVSGSSVHAFVGTELGDVGKITTSILMFMIARETAWVAAARTMSWLAIILGTGVSIAFGLATTLIPKEYAFSIMILGSSALVLEMIILTSAHLIKKLRN